jgi:hypothetical protein
MATPCGCPAAAGSIAGPRHGLRAASQFVSTVSVRSCTPPEGGVNVKMPPSAAMSYGYGCTPTASTSRITTNGVPSSTSPDEIDPPEVPRWQRHP